MSVSAFRFYWSDPRLLDPNDPLPRHFSAVPRPACRRHGGHSAMLKDTSKKRTRNKEECDIGRKTLHDPHGLKLRSAARAQHWREPKRPVPKKERPGLGATLPGEGAPSTGHVVRRFLGNPTFPGGARADRVLLRSVSPALQVCVGPRCVWASRLLPGSEKREPIPDFVSSSKTELWD
jgi:hypothetical protein